LTVLPDRASAQTRRPLMAGKSRLDVVVSAFGAEAKRKLANPVISGEPEGQLRGPLEVLLPELARVAGITNLPPLSMTGHAA
jgi:hypothetical protein